MLRYNETQSSDLDNSLIQHSKTNAMDTGLLILMLTIFQLWRDNLRTDINPKKFQNTHWNQWRSGIDKIRMKYFKQKLYMKKDFDKAKSYRSQHQVCKKLTLQEKDNDSFQ